MNIVPLLQLMIQSSFWYLIKLQIMFEKVRDFIHNC